MIFNMNCGGNSVDFNFSVVRYDSESDIPEVAEENTIAIITEHEITSWMFSDIEPDVKEPGMVWIKTNLDSAITFNTLKENCIQTYLISAQQYIGDAWTKVTMKIYQDRWIIDELVWFADGVFNTDVFGEPNKHVKEAVESGVWFNTSSTLTSTVEVDITPYSTYQFDITQFGWAAARVQLRSKDGKTIASTSGQDVGTYKIDLTTIQKQPVIIHYYATGNNYAGSEDTVRINNMKFLL